MELVGEEKRIQALFSEARLADEQTTPSFVGVWNRASAKTNPTQRAFNLSFVTATALLVCALVSLAWWVRQSQPTQGALVAIGPRITIGGFVIPSVKDPAPLPATGPRGERSRAPKLSAARREAVLVAANQANQKAARDAKAIASWQSPTATLMESSSDEMLKSLPQLSQSVDELKSFLPNKPK